MKNRGRSNHPRSAQANPGGDFSCIRIFGEVRLLPAYPGGAYELLAVRPESLDLPEEVRAAIEERKDEIHSEEDLRRMAYELMLRR